MQTINQHTPLSDFNKELILEILANDMPEDLFIEFKSVFDPTHCMLEAKVIADYKYDVRCSISSLANSLGGFIIFGIADNRHSHKHDRLNGIKTHIADTELGHELSKIYLSPNVCEPRINIEGPNLIDIDGTKVAIFKITAFSANPHAVKSDPRRSLEFWHRGTGLKQPMSYHEIQGSMDKVNRRSLRIEIELEVKDLQRQTERNLSALAEGKHSLMPFTVPSWVYQLPNVIRYFGIEEDLIKKLFQLRSLTESSNYYIANLEQTFLVWVTTSMHTDTDISSGANSESIARSKDCALKALTAQVTACNETIVTLEGIGY